MAFTNAPSIGGGYDVKEAFMETLVPVLRDSSFGEGFDVSLAVRFAEYEGSGSVWAWKAGGDWQIMPDLRFRLTRSRDIRAANLNERFNATTGGGTVIDPDFGDEQYTVSVHVGGNPDVNPEFSDAITYGFVYQPSWLEGFSASIDYFDIRISDAINQIGITNIMVECYRIGAFCNQIIRGVDGRVQVVRNVFINLDEFRTRGADIELGYRTPVEIFGGDERLSLRMIGSHLFESSITPYQADKLERAGLGDFAPWNVVLNATYMRGPLTVAWSERWRSAAVQDVYWVTGIDVDNNRIASQSLSNLRISYNFESQAGSYNVYGAINNIFDRNPGDVMGLNNIYGNMGRNYTLGVRYNF